MAGFLPGRGQASWQRGSGPWEGPVPFKLTCFRMHLSDQYLKVLVP